MCRFANLALFVLLLLKSWGWTDFDRFQLAAAPNTFYTAYSAFDITQAVITGEEWRSDLYPSNWKPGYKDAGGRFLHDFSYAGYHKGESEIPHITENVVDVTLSPYNADNTGTEDVTAILQQALDDVGGSGGGVVYLPAGTYLIRTADGSDHALRIRHDSTVLRGAGTGSTFLYHNQTYMRQKSIIQVMDEWASWFNETGTTTHITSDLPEPTNIIPVESVAGFEPGDQVVVASSATGAFIAEHKMAGIWTESAIKGVAFLREIESVDAGRNLLILDAPTRYFLKTRDLARVYHAREHIREVGIEHLSIGNLENPKTGWEEESYSSPGTGAYDVHFSHAIRFDYGIDCWIRNVNTYKPTGNSTDIHLLSNGILLNQSRCITVDSCDFQKPQYEGGGGNGYMFTLQSNDCLVSTCRANHSRHNYDFKYPFSNGNVIHRCIGENSKYSSDFHMYLSMSNLFDCFTVNGDYLESAFRPWGGDAIHGYSSTQSVFYNTHGEAYHASRDYIVESRQFGWGYIIGTSGPAYKVVLDPVEGETRGYTYNTSPRDFTEGIGTGENLVPSSLYLDQFERRMNDSVSKYDIEILVKDEESGEVMPGCEVRLYDELKVTDAAGKVSYSDIYGSLIMDINKTTYNPLVKRQVVIYSDTTLTVFLSKSEINVTIRLFDINTGETFWGARVSFDSENGVTDADGKVSFTSFAGTHEYNIEKLKYQSESGNIYVYSDTTLDFYLIRTHADIKFWLYQGESPANKALVIVNTDSIVTSSLGRALFRELPVSFSYHYHASKDGFIEREGEIFLTTDTTLWLTLQPLPSGTVFNEVPDRIVCWPNPAGDFIHLVLPLNHPGHSIRIMDLLGREFSRKEVYNAYCSLDLQKLTSGTYLLEILSGNVRTTRKFIKH